MKDPSDLQMKNNLLSNSVLKSIGALPVVIVIVMMILLNTWESSQVFESPVLLALLNTAFLCVIPLLVAYMAAKSHRTTGAFGFLYVGVGLAFFGISSFYAGWVLPLVDGPNPTVTLHNLGSLLSGISQLLAAHFFVEELAGVSPIRTPFKRFGVLYTGIIILVSITAVLAFRGDLPVFFDPLTGASPLRQFVLGGAVCMFAVAGLAFMEIFYTTKTEFAYWYGLALWLIALGLACVFLQRSVGSVMGWTGRSAQYIGTLYFIFAFLQGQRELSANSSSSSKTGWTLWPYLEQRVMERTIALLQINEALQKEITERKQAEELLRESEANWRAVLNVTNESIYLVAADRTLLALNNIAAQRMGRSPEELIGHNISDLLPVDVIAQREPFIKQVLLNCQQVTFEDDRNGRRMLNHLCPIFNADGQVIRLAVYSSDITDRKRSEDALLESNTRMSNIIEGTRAGTWEWNIQTGETDFNEIWAEIIGYTLKELLPTSIKTWESLAHPDDLERSNELLRRHFAGEIPYYNCECRMRHKDGHWIWVLDRGRVITHSSDGKPLMMFGTHIDITERKQTEEKLRESEERYKVISNLTSDYAYSFRYDVDGTAVREWTSDAFLKITGYLPTEPQFRSGITSIVPSEDRHIFQERHRCILAKEETGPITHRIVRKDGEIRWLSNYGRALYDASTGNLIRFYGAVQDITARKQAEEALQKARDELEQRVAERTTDLTRINTQLDQTNIELKHASRLKSEFLSSMSHELRTPLTGILGLSESLQLNTYGELNERQRKAMRNIEISGQHLLALINDILDLSKIEANKFEIVPALCSVSEICQASLQLTKDMAEKKHQRVSFTMNPVSITVTADARRIKQMLVNLIGNAIKFTPENGQLGLEVEGDEMTHLVKFTVWDKGIGIEAEKIKQLFKPFVQLDGRLARQYNGAGLGLSLVKGMADLHGGTVEVQSVIGEGSRFTILLPWTN